MNYFLKLSLVENLFLQKNPLQDFLSSLNAVISTNESTEFITGHVGGNLEEELHYFAAKNGWEGWAHLVLPLKTATSFFLRVIPSESP